MIDGHKDLVDGNDYGIIAYTAPLRDFFGSATFLTDVNGSANMAVDARLGGTPDVVYLDEPTTNWTNSALSGVWDFGSTAITPQGGTESIDATATVNGSQALMQRTSPIDLGSYAAISGYIYLTSWNDAKHDVNLEVRLAGGTVGNSVNINNYIDVGTLNAWQPFVIPKVDMGLNGSVIDQFLFTTESTSGQPPNYYLDTINIEEVGSKVFTFAPLPGQVFELDTVHLTFSDNITVVEPNQIMSLPALTNGIRFRTVIDGVTRFSGGVKTIHAFLSTGVNVGNQVTGAADTTLALVSPNPGINIRFSGDTEDVYSVVISDDFSTLTGFTVYIRGRLLK
jgi:hypothetical protein